MKKILLFAIAVLFLVSCDKEMNSGSSRQANATLKGYSDLATQALIAKGKDDDKNFKGIDDDKDKGKDGKNKDDDKGKNDKGKDKDDDDVKSLKITGAGTLSYTPNGCGSGTVQIKSTGTANSTHLGILSQVTTICLNPLTGDIVAPVTGVGTSPNGDKLFYLFVGAGIDAATGFLYQEYIFTGGTGKYKHAEGGMKLIYSVNTATDYKYSGTGTLSL